MRSSAVGLWVGSLFRHFLMKSLHWELTWCQASELNVTLLLIIDFLVSSSDSSRKGERSSMMWYAMAPRAQMSTLESPIPPLRTSGDLYWRSDRLLLILVFVKLEANSKPYTKSSKLSLLLLLKIILAGCKLRWIPFLSWSYCRTSRIWETMNAQFFSEIASTFLFFTSKSPPS